MRLSIDIDGKDNLSQLRMLRSYFFLRRLTDMVELWETRNGYHIIAFVPDLELSEEELMTWRLMLGDDPDRVRLDHELHGKPEMVLFNMKQGYIKRRITRI